MDACVRIIVPILFLGAGLQITFASDAKSFFAYIKEHAVEEPLSVDELASGGREARQVLNITLNFAAMGQALNGISNFSFPIGNVPTNFPVSCAGSELNYCNYPDLPLIETYDLNYYSRRPIPSGRCPEGYTKLQAFDCLNIAPALFETTCCVYQPTTTVTTLTDTTQVNALFCLCNSTTASTCYIITTNDVAYGFNVSSTTGTAQPVSGPISVASLTGGCLTSGVAEAETSGSCNVLFFNFQDQVFQTDFTTSVAGSCIGPRLVTDIGFTGTPSVVYSLGRGGPLIAEIDGTNLFLTTLITSLTTSTTRTKRQTATTTTTTTNNQFLFFGEGTNDLFTSAAVQPPLLLRSTPFINASAAAYVPSVDAILFIINIGGVNQVFFVTRQGTLLGGATATANAAGGFTLTGGRALCSVFNACGGAAGSSATSGTVIAPLVYIPYPIYPVFTGQQTTG